MPQNNLPEPGEFTRIFKRMHSGAQQQGSPEAAEKEAAEKNTAEASGIFPAPEAPGEQTLRQSDVPPAAAAPPRTPVAPGPPATPSSPEPGEFTQYFRGGLPTPGPAPGGAPTPQRPPAGVQRPNTPMPPPRSLPADISGNFTERFAVRSDGLPRKSDEFGMQNPRLGPPPDLSRRSSFDEKSPLDVKSPEKKNAPGEYTALFGHGSLPPAPRQSTVTPPPPAPLMSDSPNPLSSQGGLDRTMREIPVTPQRPQGPSEFTLIAEGRQQAPGAAPTGSSPAGEPNSAAGARKMPVPVNVSINPVNPLSSVPTAGAHLPGASAQASMSGANVSSAFGSANVSAPPIPPLNPAAAIGAAAGATKPKLSDQTKLILFFGILAILAVILVVFVVATQKS